MRFFKDGPSIPDALLERRDEGRAVFLCGAGVSVPAGMPNFVCLTKYVVECIGALENPAVSMIFDPADNGNGKSLLMPLDQVFHLLYHEYGREAVNELVAERLKETTSEPSNKHSLIARISSDQEGKPQIVTTNFDRLFEKCPNVTGDRIFVPPVFPGIEFGESIDGVTYLHGRLPEPDNPRHNYVLSSGDFGRAYLAEGWATNFMRTLLEKYTVVLVGYRAEDPPVKYLLQGLNHDGGKNRSNLYVFDKGNLEGIEEKWRSLGVAPIAYNEHSDLWKTLEAWASRADDSGSWRNSVVEMAKQNPRTLRPYERGQVAHLVRTNRGAKLFSQTEPSPPAEWLCVFDASCRSAKKYQSPEGEFDPLEAYRLDDDPERDQDSIRESVQQVARLYDQLLEWRSGDMNPPTGHTLTGRSTERGVDIPPRLSNLLNWSLKHLNDPCLAWWATTKHYSLHPHHADQLRAQMRIMGNDLHPKARAIWNLILEAMADKRHSYWNHNWFELFDRVKSDGWTDGVLRHFEDTMGPVLTYHRSCEVAEVKPPMSTWDDVPINYIVSWKVRFPKRHGEDLAIPEDVLLAIFPIAENHLRRAAGLHRDIGTKYFRTPSCYPDREVDGREAVGEDDGYFRWFVGLLHQMSDKYPKALRSHALIWNHEDQFFFRKLKLLVFNYPQVFEANEAAELLLEFDQDDIWDHEVRRELLFFLVDRWSDFTDEKRIALVKRLLAGPRPTDHSSNEHYPVIMAACYTKWLELNGCELTNEQSARLAEVINRIPKWTDCWAVNIVKPSMSVGGFISTDDDPGSLAIAPVSDVIERAKSESGLDYESNTDKQPFAGLVKAKPRKALAALSHASRQKEYPAYYWKILIQYWPDDVSARLNRVFLHRLSRLPHDIILDLKHPLADYLKQKLKVMYDDQPELAWTVFDAVVSVLASDGGSGLGSGIFENRKVGDEVGQSRRRTFGHAINRPIGMMTEGWIHTLHSLKLPQGHGFPVEFQSRLEQMLAAPGEGGDHAVAVITHQINWLHYLDPAWTLTRVIPWFNFKHPAAEPAWNGYLSAARFPLNDIGKELKPMLLELFPTVYQWNWSGELAKIGVQLIIELAIYHRENTVGLTVSEARHCIRKMSDESRQDAIFHLVHIIGQKDDDWEKYLIPFIKKIWPKERRFKTTETVLAWVNLLGMTGDRFPAMLDCVRQFLFPVEGDGLWMLAHFSRKVGCEESLATMHPARVLEMLDALIPNNPQATPYKLALILYMIKDADPRLVKNPRFCRLIDLVEQR